jgi:hypothetical protein
MDFPMPTCLLLAWGRRQKPDTYSLPMKKYETKRKPRQLSPIGNEDSQTVSREGVGNKGADINSRAYSRKDTAPAVSLRTRKL